MKRNSAVRTVLCQLTFHLTHVGLNSSMLLQSFAIPKGALLLHHLAVTNPENERCFISFPQPDSAVRSATSCLVFC